MKKNAGYIIKHDDKVIMLTKAYAKQSSAPGTKEFRELAKLHKTFPDYEIVMRTATITAEKNTHAGLKVDVIEKIIARQPNSEELKREYAEMLAIWGREVEDKKNPGKTVIRVPYGKVKSWFLDRVPNYRNIDFSQSASADEDNND